MENAINNTKNNLKLIKISIKNITSTIRSMITKGSAPLVCFLNNLVDAC